MTKSEIFTNILEVTGEVCSVDVADIMGGVRKADVCVARSLVVFWCYTAGFEVESLLELTERSNANSINTIKSRIEEYWRDKWAYHMLAKEIGVRLHKMATDVGEDFDYMKPINRMNKMCRS